jgi:polyribonucleotide nucleotidyltransferase
MSKTFKLAGSNLEVEIGKIAKQADGSAWLKYGNNVVMSTAVYAKKTGSYLGFFPLTVEYRDKASAT